MSQIPAENLPIWENPLATQGFWLFSQVRPTSAQHLEEIAVAEGWPLAHAQLMGKVAAQVEFEMNPYIVITDEQDGTFTTDIMVPSETTLYDEYIDRTDEKHD